MNQAAADHVLVKIACNCRENPMLHLCRLALTLAAGLASVLASDHPHHVSWQGPEGLPGSGKHIVYIANDHEYRAEETLPALARIMARHYGFTCTFITGVDPETGYIQKGNGQISGLEVLESADLLVVGLRFQHWPDEEFQHLDAYLAAGKPVIGVRTSTHAFKLSGKYDGPYKKFDWKYKGEDYPFGFGEQVLGEHWVGHYGKNHEQSSLLKIEAANADHVVLTGVHEPIHVVSGGYTSEVTEADGNTILLRGHVLDGMTPDSPPSESKTEKMAVAWLHQYGPEAGAEPFPTGRVLGTLHGCSEDILDDGYRRLLVNAHLWCLQMDDAIAADNPIEFVGGYHPTMFCFGSGENGPGRLEVKPQDIAGFDTPIYDPEKPIGEPKGKIGRELKTR